MRAALCSTCHMQKLREMRRKRCPNNQKGHYQPQWHS